MPEYRMKAWIGSVRSRRRNFLMIRVSSAAGQTAERFPSRSPGWGSQPVSPRRLTFMALVGVRFIHFRRGHAPVLASRAIDSAIFLY